MKQPLLVPLALLVGVNGAIAQPSDSCDTAPEIVYYGGTVVTMDPSDPYAEAIALRADSILAVGSDTDLLALAGTGCETLTTDLNGMTVLPGFIESHSHWFSWREHICSVTGETTYPELEEIMDHLSENGWTSISELNFGRPDFAPEHFDNAMDLDGRGELTVRVNGYWGTYDDVSMIDILVDAGRTPDSVYSERVRAPGVKLYVDNPFGAFDILSQEEVNTLVEKAHEAGWQIAAHAVNQSAVEKILTAYEHVLGPASNDSRRHRIEHAVKVSDDQLARMQAKGIIASFQLLGPPDWPAQSDFGDRFLTANPEWVLRWRDFVGAELGGARNTGSSDAPFNDAPCDPSPFRLIYQAVTRDGYVDRTPESWELDQTISVFDALSLLTVDGAYATFEEDKKGSLERGKWADFVVLSRNPLELESPEELLDIEVLLTAVGGEIEYCNERETSGLCTLSETFPVDGGLVSASSYLPDQTPDLAFDGSTDTNWGAGDHPPQWIEITLNEPTRIGGVDLVTEQFPDGHTVHQIWAKKNEGGSELELLHQFAGHTTTDQVLTFTAADDIEPYDTFRIVTTESPSWVSWREIVFKPFSATAGEPDDPLLPGIRELVHHFPNPGRARVTFRIEREAVESRVSEQTELLLHDLLGRPVRRWILPTGSAGIERVEWDGTDGLGKPVPSGIYVYRLSGAHPAMSHRLVLVR